ncbi:sigma-70 family RNA polymerase sigma factor [Corallococcus exiguus]|uniref:Sigma-70 family RNA polymerase sigma factor n=1 Tax=Corallococcus exiguus TaxID=83462 RepID=A0A7Y1WTK7_9BACT|nr:MULTISPECIES: sigma-70 family RNA polymerase sigma factor [Corallococcus]NBC42196.1 sigma-70 family RNA polymerase sigma factor [Corallococcus exiguus]NNC14360.1 sigma-70 family RNA polymerase sigma factor [Corallococcus exiguus]NPC45684.1 sigma-70 family RNA polymerase sigma factor [Corallococcus exiguus]NRD53562.1 sigma-70 family RNA polymerase sigma factor [Corallococcus exiguus]NRD60204.1 sigma-70 family RNA polymerase sigma factor [Corallococcus exiguus]
MSHEAPQEEDRQEEDRRLLMRAQDGDVSAFEALVGLHQDRVYGLALRMTRSEADAAEITQDTFLSAYQHLKDFRGEAAFGSWVHRIAANHALMRLRHRRVAQAAESELQTPEFTERGTLADYPVSDWSRDAEEKALDAELGQAIQQAADRLPEGYREVFLLKDVDGLSYEQIAEVTGDSIPAIKSRLHRARLALREAIDLFYNRDNRGV